MAFLVCSAPLFTAIFTLIFSRFGKSRYARGLEKVRLGWPLVGGTVLALLGMALMVFDGKKVQLSAAGDLLAIGAALCWAVYSLFMGLIASLVCFLVWNLVIDKLGNVTSTNYVYLNPIFTLLSAMALLGERMTLLAAVGSVLILVGVIWAGRH